jgi:hypothetical protein
LRGDSTSKEEKLAKNCFLNAEKKLLWRYSKKKCTSYFILKNALGKILSRGGGDFTEKRQINELGERRLQGCISSSVRSWRRVTRGQFLTWFAPRGELGP